MAMKQTVSSHFAAGMVSSPWHTMNRSTLLVGSCPNAAVLLQMAPTSPSIHNCPAFGLAAPVAGSPPCICLCAVGIGTTPAAHLCTAPQLWLPAVRSQCRLLECTSAVPGKGGRVFTTAAVTSLPEHLVHLPTTLTYLLPPAQFDSL
jgi:hypothetical protein